MQDEFGRPLSDDGQWVWDGTAWRPTGAGAGPPASEPNAGTPGLEPTMVAPRDYDPTGGQPPQGYGQQGGYPYPSGAQPGPYGPGVPPRSQPPAPFYKKPVVIIGALLVLSAVLVTVILLTRGGGGDNNPGPSAGPLPTTVPSSRPSDIPTTEPTTGPTDSTTPEPTDTPPSSDTAGSTIDPGPYNCSSGGSQVGTVTVAGHSYVTDSGGRGTYNYDSSTGGISFTGGDLGDYTGTYDSTAPSMDLTSSNGLNQVHCSQ